MESEEEMEALTAAKVAVTLCSTCNLTIDYPKMKYQCSSCVGKSSNSKGNDEKLYICHVCIQPHVRQKHDVIDNKEMNVVDCSKHLTVCTMFCKDCKSLICYLCLSEHVEENHETCNVEERAASIKADIHELISELDQDFKPLACVVSNARSFLSDYRNLKVDFLPDAIEANLKQAFDSVVTAHLPNIEVVAEKADTIERGLRSAKIFVENDLEQLSSQQCELRRLLSLSDGPLIKDWLNPQKFGYIKKLSAEQERLEGENTDISYSRKLIGGVEKKLRQDLEKVFMDYTDSLSEIACLGLQPNENLPNGVALFRNFSGNKVQLACSATHICIATFLNDIATLEFYSPEQRKVSEKLKVDDGNFRLFNCYQGVVVQVSANRFTAFETKGGKISKYDEWQTAFAKVDGFLFHQQRFYAYTIGTAADHWTFQCENQIYCNQQNGSGYNYMVSSQLYPTDPAYCHNGPSGLLCGRKSKTSRFGKAYGRIDVAKLTVVDKMSVEASPTGLVTVAVAYSRSDPTFAIVKLDYELVPYGDTRHASLKLDSRVTQVCFFDSVCYMALEDGRVLRWADLLEEM